MISALQVHWALATQRGEHAVRPIVHREAMLRRRVVARPERERECVSETNAQRVLWSRLERRKEDDR